VSFNQDAFESYGNEQGANSPIGIRDAFKYCTALNALTNDRDRCIHLGDTTIVFWAEQSSPFECSILPAFLTSGWGEEDSSTLSELRSTFQSLRQGRKVNDIDPSTPFYLLGLAPNAARLSVRFWITGTIAEFAERIDLHLADLELEPTPDDLADLSIRRLICETVPPRGGWADEGAITPLLAGSVLRAILTGGPYPQSLLCAVINRVRTEGMIDDDRRKDWRQAQHRRCAIIKACLQRNARIAGHEKEIPVSFNPERPEVAYQLGRLFAALEKAQEDAMPGLNATIKDRYFGSASATPGVVFPRLCRMHQHHIEKLEGGLKVVREKLIQEIMGRLDTFPSHLSLDDQGLFAIGYYHQRQFFFTKKEDRLIEEPANA
jgi:CRISPR-associated protein Csd1